MESTWTVESFDKRIGFIARRKFDDVRSRSSESLCRCRDGSDSGSNMLHMDSPWRLANSLYLQESPEGGATDGTVVSLVPETVSTSIAETEMTTRKDESVS